MLRRCNDEGGGNLAMERERGAKNAAFKEQSQNKKLLVNLKAERVARGYQGTKSPNKKIEK